MVILPKRPIIPFNTYHRLDETDFGEGRFFFDTQPRPPEYGRKLFGPRGFVRRRDVLQTVRAPIVHRVLGKKYINVMLIIYWSRAF